MKITNDEFIRAYKKKGPKAKDIQAYLNTKGIEMSHHSIRSRISRMSRSGLLKLKSGNSVGIGEQLRGTSTLYDASGNVKIQWVKTDAKKENDLEYFKEAIEEFISSANIKPRPAIKAPSIVDADTMSVYSMGDAHIGMLAWGAETGEDYDTDICVADLVAALTLLVEQAHPSEEAFVIDVGDFFHSNGQANTTAAGTRVDVDTRFAKMIQAGLDVTVALINKALTKHKVVHWRSAIGNHDTHTSLYVTSFVKAWFRNDPRVVVHDTPAMFMYHQFGKNLIGITHGHTVKAEKLGEIMSVDCKEQWSSTDHRYW